MPGAARLLRGARADRTLPLFVITLACLLASGAITIETLRRTTALRQRVAQINEPAQIELSRVQGGLAREIAAIRGFLLTGDSQYVDERHLAQGNRAHALVMLGPLTDSLGPSFSALRQSLARVLIASEAPVDSLLEGRISRTAYIARIGGQQSRFEDALAEARELETAIAADVRNSLSRIRRIDRLSAGVSVLLAVIVLVAVVLVVQIGRAQRRLAAQLAESETRFREIADNVNDFVSLSAVGFTRVLYANPAYERIWDRPVEKLCHDPEEFMASVHPEDRARFLRARARAAAQPVDVEYRIVRPSDEERWVWTRYVPIRDAGGEVYRIAGITEDVTERKAADERRMRLIRGFSHDVKNPLGAADGLLSLLEDGVLGDVPPNQLETIRRARHSVGSGVNLVRQLLEIIRAEHGRLEIRRSRVRLADIASEVVDELRAAAQAKNQALVFARDDEDLKADTDAARVRQVIVNLVTNAIKYSPPGARTTVSVRSHEDEPGLAGIGVRDTGPGIPAEKQAILFREFVRLDPTASDGAGIGLAFSQNLANALGGRIDVESAPGRGSEFTLWLRAASRSVHRGGVGNRRER